MCVAAIFPKRNDAFLLPYFISGENATNSPDRKPNKYTLDQICEEIQSEKISLNTIKLESFKEVPEEFLYGKGGEPLPSTKERDRRFEIVSKLLSFEDELYYPMFGKGPIAAVAKELNITRTNTQRYLNVFYRGGRHKNSLIPSTGRHSSSPTLGSRKLGRPRFTIAEGVIGKNVTSQDKKNIKRIGKRDYIGKKQLSFKTCYQNLLDECYSLQKGSIAPDGTKTSTKHLNPNELISENQFSSWLPILLDLSKNQIQEKRRQKSDHDANFAGRAGHSEFEADGPGDIWQMDSTPLDIELVTPYDRNALIKRVTLYVVRDVFSRSIVGIHVAYGNASWKEARVALFHAIRNKVDYAKEYGLHLDENDWSEHGTPRCLLVDNEEFQNKISRSVGKDLQLMVMFSRAYRGDDKGLSESSFHMINAMVRNEVIPGFKYKRLMGRNRNLPLKTACLTAFEFQQILIIYAIYHNNHVWKEKFPIQESAMKAGLNKVCREYWDWGLQYRNYYLQYKPERQLYLSLLEVGVLTVHKTHLHLQEVGINYYCDEIRAAGVQNRPMAGVTRTHRTLSCRYIRSSVNKILIEFQGRLVVGYLTNEFRSECSKMNVADINSWKHNQKIRQDMHMHKTSGSKSDFSVDVQHIANTAKAAKIAAKSTVTTSHHALKDRNAATQKLADETDQTENLRFDNALIQDIEFPQTFAPTTVEENNQLDAMNEHSVDDEDDEFFDLMEGH